MKNIPKKHENPNYYVSLVILQTYKNAILRSVHSLGCHFTPYVFVHPFAFFWAPKVLLPFFPPLFVKVGMWWLKQKQHCPSSFKLGL